MASEKTIKISEIEASLLVQLRIIRKIPFLYGMKRMKMIGRKKLKLRIKYHVFYGVRGIFIPIFRR